MLKSPRYGWSEITIGDWSDRCSDLDDVPFLLLKSVTKVCRSGSCAVAGFDAEGWEYLIVFGNYETHIITETDDGYTLHTASVPIQSLAKSLLEDIHRDLELWSRWTDYGDMAKAEAERRKSLLLTRCSLLEKSLEKEGLPCYTGPA